MLDSGGTHQSVLKSCVASHFGRGDAHNRGGLKHGDRSFMEGSEGRQRGLGQYKEEANRGKQQIRRPMFWAAVWVAML